MAVKTFKGTSVFNTMSIIKAFLTENGIRKGDYTIFQKNIPDGQNYTHIIKVEYHKSPF